MCDVFLIVLKSNVFDGNVGLLIFIVPKAEVSAEIACVLMMLKKQVFYKKLVPMAMHDDL